MEKELIIVIAITWLVRFVLVSTGVLHEKVEGQKQMRLELFMPIDPLDWYVCLSSIAMYDMEPGAWIMTAGIITSIVVIVNLRSIMKKQKIRIKKETK